MNKSVRSLPALAAAIALTPSASAQEAVTGRLLRASGAVHWPDHDYPAWSASGSMSARPDLGIGADDVGLKARAVTVTMRGLGSAAAPGGTLFLEGPSGRTLASTKIAALAAPTDLGPKTAKVRLTVPAGAAVETLHLHLVLADGGREIATRNSVSPLARVPRR